MNMQKHELRSGCSIKTVFCPHIKSECKKEECVEYKVTKEITESDLRFTSYGFLWSKTKAHYTERTWRIKKCKLTNRVFSKEFIGKERKHEDCTYYYP